MSDDTPRSVETLVKNTVTVKVDDQTYTVSSFRFGKSMRAMAYLSEVAETADLGDAVGKLTDGELTVAGLIGQLLAVLPKLLQRGIPSVYRFLGLVITPNKELMDMEDDDAVDVDRELLRRGRVLAYAGDVEEVINLIIAGVQTMGVETILGKFLPLLRAMK